MESGYDRCFRWTVWDSVSDAHCDGDVNGNASSISDTVLSASNYPVIDSDDYDR